MATRTLLIYTGYVLCIRDFTRGTRAGGFSTPKPQVSTLDFNT